MNVTTMENRKDGHRTSSRPMVLKLKLSAFLCHITAVSKTLGKEPNPQVCCDLPECNNCIHGRLACYHTFHVSCLPSDHCCSICKQPLEELIKNKVSQFNEGLLRNGSTESDDDSSDSETEDDTATRVDSETNNGNTEQYYTSVVWEKKVDSILSAIGEIEQPCHPNAQASHAHSQSQSSTIQTDPRSTTIY